jgi:hypothetical protein
MSNKKPTNVIAGTANSVSNTAILVINAFRSPLTTNIVTPPNEPPETTDPAKKTGGPGFNLALIAVIAFTAFCGVVLVGMSATFPDHANAIQTSAFDTMRNGFWAGLGALVGLIGGKAT